MHSRTLYQHAAGAGGATGAAVCRTGVAVLRELVRQPDALELGDLRRCAPQRSHGLHARAHAHTLTHTRTHAHAHAHTHTHTHTRARVRARARIHRLTSTHESTHARTRPLCRQRTHAKPAQPKCAVACWRLRSARADGTRRLAACAMEWHRRDATGTRRADAIASQSHRPKRTSHACRTSGKRIPTAPAARRARAPRGRTRHGRQPAAHATRARSARPSVRTET